MKRQRMLARLPWRWLPGSLFGRNLLLIFVLVVVAELSILLLFRQWIQEPRVAAMQRFAVQEARQQRALLQGLDTAGRAHWQRTLGATAPPQSGVPDTLAAQRFVTALAAELHTVLGPECDVRWQGTPSGPAPAQVQAGLWLGVRVDGAWYWRTLDHSGIPGNLPPFMLSVTLASGALALLAAALIQRRINQPLQELAQAAVAFGRGTPLPPDWPSGPSQLPREIAQLAGAMQQMAQDLDAAGEERALMLAGVSHDLRTPLTKMRLAVEILAAEARSPDDVALLQGMVTQIAAANSVIEQFIAFARCGSEEARQEVDVAELLHSVWQALSASERQRVVLDLPPEAGLCLYCLPVALRRAVGNLLENALRHGLPEQAAGGPAELACIVLSASVAAGQLRLTVQDRGPGIPAQELARMRQPFTRMAQHSSQAGSGLGLAIVERIARLHQGQLDLLPRTGGGLVAQMVLPLQQG